MRLEDLKSFTESSSKWSGQLSSSKKVECIIEAYHVPTFPARSVFPVLSFLNLSAGRVYSSAVADEFSLHYATM